MEVLPTALKKSGEAPKKLKALKLLEHRELRLELKEPKVFKKWVESSKFGEISMVIGASTMHEKTLKETFCSE